MPQADPRVVDMLVYARRVRDRVEGIDRATFDRDEDLQIILTHWIQIVGEAAARVPQDLREKIPLPWREIVGMRHRIVHHYMEIDLEQVWETATRDMSPLIEALEPLISQAEQQGD